jgi:hypothetical protein
MRVAPRYGTELYTMVIGLGRKKRGILGVAGQDDVGIFHNYVKEYGENNIFIRGSDCSAPRLQPT